jgi:hypothetical protein
MSICLSLSLDTYLCACFFVWEPVLWITSVAMQRAVNTPVEEEVFSLDPPRDYICGTEQNPVSRRKRTRMERVLGSQGRRIRLKIDCVLL